MEEERIEDLIAELERLSVRTAAVLTKLEAAKAKQAKHLVRGPQQQHKDRAITPTGVNGIAKGDRVWIANRIKKPATWPQETQWVESEYRSATVTSVSREQIHVITDNGVETWRAPNNLRKLQ
jgi:hypothetical protein